MSVPTEQASAAINEDHVPPAQQSIGLCLPVSRPVVSFDATNSDGATLAAFNGWVRDALYQVIEAPPAPVSVTALQRSPLRALRNRIRELQ
jgi:hypothetical protein